MRKIVLLSSLFAFMISCKNENKPDLQAEIVDEATYASFGDSITASGYLTKEELLQKYESMSEGDTLDIKFLSTIKGVCQKKGCWMNVELDSTEKAFVRFKDYAFFMPLNAAESEAIVDGKAYISVESVNDLKHYAKDAGKTQEEIDAITEPRITYAFMADGVLIKE